MGNVNTGKWKTLVEVPNPEATEIDEADRDTLEGVASAGGASPDGWERVDDDCGETVGASDGGEAFATFSDRSASSVSTFSSISATRLDCRISANDLRILASKQTFLSPSPVWDGV